MFEGASKILVFNRVSAFRYTKVQKNTDHKEEL